VIGGVWLKEICGILYLIAYGSPIWLQERR